MNDNQGKTDVVVVGGGPCGLITGCILSQAGLRVQTFTWGGGSRVDDSRAIALLDNSINLLKSIGVWASLSSCAAPLEAICIVDDTHGLLRCPNICFRASDFDLDAFGFSIPYHLLVRELEAHAAKQPLHMLKRERIADVIPEEHSVTVFSGETSEIQARLVIGADGIDSVCRNVSGIGCTKHDYGQTALTFNVDHTVPHGNISTEFHTDSGPFTLVPLQNEKSSSIVWSVRSSDVDSILRSPEKDLLGRIERGAHGITGKVTKVDLIGHFPSRFCCAERFAAQRIVLIGNAAHTLPPIGAQGLNLGFGDAEALATMLSGAFHEGRDIGSSKVLIPYSERRKRDISGYLASVDLLNRSIVESRFLHFQMGRFFAFSAMKQSKFLREMIVKFALGAKAQT